MFACKEIETGPIHWSGCIDADWLYLSNPADWVRTGVILLGVIVAIVVPLFIYRRQANERTDDLRRQRLAARAILALDLSRIMQYAIQSANAAKLGDQINSGESADRIEVECPELDIEIVVRLQRLAELLSGVNADQVVELMQCYQIQHARLNGVLTTLNSPDQAYPRSTVLTTFSFQETLMKTVDLYIRCERMFPFARREQENIEAPPFSEDETNRVFFFLDLDSWLTGPSRDRIINHLAR